VRARRWGPWTLALALAGPLALAYAIARPPAADLAAATYRSDLFARVGYTLRDAGWYAGHGHYLLGYSLLSPALGALVGVYALLALSAVVSAALFALVAEGAFGTRAAAHVAAAVFAVGFGVGLLSGRVPYDLGVAIGLGAVLAVQRGRLGLALALAALCGAASPVAGLFLALAGIALALARPAADGRTGAALAAAALAPVAVLTLAFPDGGWEPFDLSAFWPVLAGAVAVALLLPRGTLPARARRAVRIGAGLYAVALCAAYAVHTPMGGNAARLGALLGAPLLAGGLWARHRRALVALAPLLLYWQLVTPIQDFEAIANDPSTRAAYYAPLLAELRRLTDGRPTRIEVPLTASHWEAADLAGHDGVALARGWERQLDTRYAPLFYRPGLTAAAYETWLAQNGVAYVALADAPLDYSARAEAALVRGGLPFLAEVWRSRHWRLYRVRAA
jgi:hypothetical protein